MHQEGETGNFETNNQIPINPKGKSENNIQILNNPEDNFEDDCGSGEIKSDEPFRNANNISTNRGKNKENLTPTNKKHILLPTSVELNPITPIHKRVSNLKHYNQIAPSSEADKGKLMLGVVSAIDVHSMELDQLFLFQKELIQMLDKCHQLVGERFQK
jgi:hypothetical protein